MDAVETALAYGFLKLRRCRFCKQKPLINQRIRDGHFVIRCANRKCRNTFRSCALLTKTLEINWNFMMKNYPGCPVIK
jgi:hypothetical protein